MQGLQVWDFEEHFPVSPAAAVGPDAPAVVGQFVSSVMLPSGVKRCLVCGDLAPRATEVFAGPLANGVQVVLLSLFNRNIVGSDQSCCDQARLGIDSDEGQRSVGKNRLARDTEER